MKRIIMLSLCSAVVVLLSSCGRYTVKHTGNKLPINNPRKIEYNQNLVNQTLLGEVEISVEYRRYLGIFRTIDKINGEEKDIVRRSKELASFTVKNNGYKVGLASKGKNRVLEAYPDADYFIISGTTKEKNTLFLGSFNKRSVTYKAYKFSDEPVEPMELYRKRHIYK